MQFETKEEAYNIYTAYAYKQVLVFEEVNDKKIL